MKEGGDIVKGKGAKYLLTQDDLTFGGGHTMQYTDHLSWKYTLETYIVLLNNVTPINLTN